MESIEGIRALSAKLGLNPMLVQAAGGNISIKNESTLWVKASGKWLAHAQAEQIFVPLDLPAVRGALAHDPDQDLNQFIQHNSTLRPSIETALHAIMPQKIVLHLHSVCTIAWAVQSCAAQELAPVLDGLHWSFVPYCRPGSRLAQAALSLLRPGSQILVLQNHGIVIGAESILEAELILTELEKRLCLSPRIAEAVNLGELNLLAAKYNLSLPRHEIVHQIAIDTHCYRVHSSGVLYPDQVVFLNSTTSNLSANEGEQLRNYGNESFFYIVPREGVLVSPQFSAASQEVLRGHALILERIPAGKSINYLTNSQIEELTEWDAEKYRQK